MNKRYRKNIEKQKDIQEKIEELKLKQEMLKYPCFKRVSKY